jgi:hypothetical protein
MDAISNPLSILTFIAAPAILTNASSVMALGTSNRFARAIDRARTLAAEIEKKTCGDEESEKLGRRVGFAERRAQILLRALTAFYVSVGSFGAASLIALLSAGFFIAREDILRDITLGAGLLAGVMGVAGLVTGSGLLVWETRLTLKILQMETKEVVRKAPIK